MRFEVSWAEFKTIFAKKGFAKSRVQCVCDEGKHDAAFADGPFVFSVHLVHGSADVEEFEAEWMAEANGPAI